MRFLLHNIDDPSLGLALLRVEEELTALAETAQEEIQEAGYSGDIRKIWNNTRILARPILQRRQAIAQQFNEASLIYLRLNDDILRMIFDYATCSMEDCYTFPGTRNLQATLCLASVAKRWRNIAVDAAFLWTSLPLSPASDCEIFKSFLRRSKAADLDISIEIGYVWQYDPSQLIGMLKPIANRVRALSIKALLFSLSVDYARLLVLHFPKAIIISVHSHDFTPLLAPALSYLRVDRQSILPYCSNYSALIFLEMSRVSVDDLITILRSTTLLKTLKATGSFGAVIGANHSSTPYTHAALENLDTNHEGIIEALTLPSLQSLCLWSHHDALPDFLKRSGCTLTRFGVQNVSELQYVIGAPSISKLVIRVATMEECGAIFQHLNEQIDPQGRIRSLKIWVDDVNTDAQFFEGHPYLLAPLISYYATNSSRIDRIAIDTVTPYEIAHLWIKLYRSLPAAVSVNDLPLTYFCHPAEPEDYMVGESPTHPRLNGRDYLTTLVIRDVDEAWY